MADRPAKVLTEDPPVRITIEPTQMNRAEWLVQFQGAEFGPYAASEFLTILKNGKLKGDIYLWRAGLENWVPVSAITNFQDALVPESRVNVRHERRRGLKSGSWVRKEPRYPLIATVSVKGLDGVLGICGDISMSGFQVLFDKRVKITTTGPFEISICPLGVSGMKPIAVKAKLSWAKAEERRAGFIFEPLDPSTKTGLERHLAGLAAREAKLGAWDKLDSLN